MRELTSIENAFVSGGDDSSGGPVETIVVTATRLPPDTSGSTFATAIGAVTGATVCTGLAIPSGGITVPAVPYCAATGGFVGGMVANLAAGTGSPGGSTWEMERYGGTSDSLPPYWVNAG